ncbi:MAG: histidine phosphatase family protein [Candidatus Limnocylindrales bacterium]
MLTLVLTRHGSTARSEPEQHLGQHLDVPLSGRGRGEALALGERLQGLSFHRIFSSPLLRARESAALVAPGREAELDARLLEMDYGRWEGLTYGEIEAVDAAVRRRWEADPASLACPGGESGEQVARRAGAFLDDLLGWAASQPRASDATSAAEHPRVMVVGHSTTNRILLSMALGLPIRDYRRRFAQAPANLTVLQFTGLREQGACLMVANDVAHVRGIRGATWG